MSRNQHPSDADDLAAARGSMRDHGTLAILSMLVVALLVDMSRRPLQASGMPMQGAAENMAQIQATVTLVAAGVFALLVIAFTWYFIAALRDYVKARTAIEARGLPRG